MVPNACHTEIQSVTALHTTLHMHIFAVPAGRARLQLAGSRAPNRARKMAGRALARSAMASKRGAT